MKRILWLLNPTLLWQGLCFAVVGCTAAAVQFTLVITLVTALAISPLWANVLAFIVAFLVSYYGHSQWTFEVLPSVQRPAIRRFFMVATIGFVLNQSIFYFLLKTTDYAYEVALLWVLLIVPPITFTASKLWAFK